MAHIQWNSLKYLAILGGYSSQKQQFLSCYNYSVCGELVIEAFLLNSIIFVLSLLGIICENLMSRFDLYHTIGCPWALRGQKLRPENCEPE